MLSVCTALFHFSLSMAIRVEFLTSDAGRYFKQVLEQYSPEVLVV
jgi:hypothetical protein